jgi:hypothetical protein
MTVKELQTLFPDSVLGYEYPKPFPQLVDKPANIKAIVLGCDPSNFSAKNGAVNQLETVFGITGKGADKRYFMGVLKNLSYIGLVLENIYVQNLCRNYFTTETAKNPVWPAAAKLWVEYLRKELELLNLHDKVPVIMTSEHIYKALLKTGIACHKAKELYAEKGLLPIKAEDNILGRELFPFYRHTAYSLEKWPEYVHLLKRNIQ